MFLNLSHTQTHTHTRARAFCTSGLSVLHGRLCAAYRHYIACTSIINNNDLGNFICSGRLHDEAKKQNRRGQRENAGLFSHTFFFAMFSPHRLQYLFALHTARAADLHQFGK